MGIADAILDLVSSGTTLKENNLKEIEGGIVLESQVSDYLIFRSWLALFVGFKWGPGNCCILCLVRFCFCFTLTIECLSGCPCCKQKINDKTERST